MRILAISDEVSDALYHENMRELTGPIDVLVGCGDLPYDYMEFVVTQAKTRHAFYVHGNHDEPQRLFSDQILYQPGGWRNLDRRSVYVREHDLLIAGLEGSIRYTPQGPYQYTEFEMAWRALWLVPQLLMNKIVHGRYVDILITHAPPRGIHDAPKGAHKGFKAFLYLIRRFRPRLFLHGHNHIHGLATWHSTYEQTDVVNVHPFRRIEFAPEKDRLRLGHVWYH